MDKDNPNLLDKFLNYDNDDENISENEKPPQLLDSPYIDDDELQFKISKFDNGSVVLSTNIRSLSGKIDQLKIYLRILNEKGIRPAAICLQETWLSDHHDLKEYELDGYHLVPKGCTTSSHGGIITYIDKQFNYKVIPVKQDKNVWEQHFIKITKKCVDASLILGNVYRPPRKIAKIVKIFDEEFKATLQLLSHLKGEVMIAGDFNHDLLTINEVTANADFFDTILSNSYLPRIVRPTRITATTDTLIDNIFMRISPLFKSSQAFILTHKFSDHQPSLMKIDLFDPRLTKKLRTIRHRIIHREGKDSLKNLITELTEKDLSNHLDITDNAEADKNYCILNDLVTNAYNKHYPKVRVKYDKYRHKNSDWITDAIMKSIRTRNKLYKKLKNTAKDDTRYENLETQLKNYNKILKRSITLAKKHYYANLFNKFQNDIRKTWRTINRLLNRDKTTDEELTAMKINGHTTTDEKIISDEFNRFFTDIGRNTADNLPTTDKTPEDYLTNRPTSTFTFKQIDEETTDRIISQELSNKSSSGFDDLSTKLVRQLKDVLVSPMTIIINQSLKSGTFPELMKIARVIPLYKKGDSESVDNYRPVSILPALSKILEKIMFEQMVEYLDEQEILSESQYGFRKNRSTDYAAIELVDRISQVLDNKKKAIAIFMDLSKAFDSLNHEILLKKLAYYGFVGNSISLLESYLSNRKQFVSWNNTNSEKRNINTGIPQGSILGPLLFIIYVNDLSKACEKFHPICFADDTTLLGDLCKFGKSTREINNNVNKELDLVSKWLLANKLSLNVIKTKYIVFREINTRKQNLSLQINGAELERVTTFKFLGLVLHENRSWTDHIAEISLKLSRTVGIMNKLRNFIPSNILQTLYNSLMAPYLNKHLLVWGKSPSSRPKILQRKAVRIINKKHRLAHSNPLFKELKILKLDDMYTRQALKLYYRCEHSIAPKHFRSFLVTRRNATSYLQEHPLRDADDQTIPLLRKTYSQKTIRYFLVKIVNSFPEDILADIHKVTYDTYSQKIKKYFISSYGSHCSVRNCYPCRVSNTSSSVQNV